MARALFRTVQASVVVIAGLSLSSVAANATTDGNVGGYGDMYYLNDQWSGRANHIKFYGDPEDETLVGDWDGDGTDTLAVRWGSVYFFTNSIVGNDFDFAIAYGRPDDDVIVGDWDGDGRDTLAVRRGNQFHIKNSLSAGPADRLVYYGRANDSLLVADWDGNGTDTFAVRRGRDYHIKNVMTGGPADRVVPYGRSADLVMVGDWDGNGADTLAVRRGNVYYVKNHLGAGAADRHLTYGRTTDFAFAGDWNGDGRDTLGVRREAPYDPDFAEYASRIIDDFNEIRAERNLPPLEEDETISRVATYWAKFLSDTGSLYANSDFEDQIPGGWIKTYEDGGYGIEPQDFAPARDVELIYSPAYLVDGDFTHAGVGLWWSDDEYGWRYSVYAAQYPEY